MPHRRIINRTKYKNKMKYVLLFFVKIYRMTLSKWLPRCCRFTPSCSEYAMIALRRFGAVKGSYLAIRRIIRCNPFSEGGYDYVPEQFYFFKRTKP
ncbi:MAG: membrane protein insertion efficiency factor YidD [[Eubacterium] siraeum]|nr:membrane protein insertion efficiency factor YidD [Ruminiclostridium sp.]MEE0010909.1 membrane protein insertion efficiency factor YidD [[Eubacterium] siraeum]HCS31329.1 membrane protein insertion efficiency factor YidD [Eubacterium sp.]MBE5717939.1 membrane protein insertion efficiency factor YidD [Ruminiclostridium sp.]MBE5719617.1 membrane protein insertion efficiency factor YidD [Ruminiclostridium sp.]